MPIARLQILLFVVLKIFSLIQSEIRSTFLQSLKFFLSCPKIRGKKGYIYPIFLHIL